MIDARRGEAFAAAYDAARAGIARASSCPPRALAPEDLASVVAQAEAAGGEQLAPGSRWATGRCASAGIWSWQAWTVPADPRRCICVGAQAICELGARAPAAASYEEIVPDYRRRPDAEIALEGVAAVGG